MTPFQIALVICIAGFALFGVFHLVSAKAPALATPRNRTIFVAAFLASVAVFGLLSALR